MAATGLVKCATDECDWIGLYHLEKIFHELFCFTNSNMMKPNDFSERAAYFLQCVIPKSIGKIKDNAGEAPARVKRFFLDKLKFNDNSENEVRIAHKFCSWFCSFQANNTYSSMTITICPRS